MKNVSNWGLAALMILMAACSFTIESSKEEPNVAAPATKWLSKEINPAHLKDVVNTYHMFDSTENKVGAMIFGLRRDGDLWIAEDTSYFDDGTIYETAQMKLDMTDASLKNLDMDIQIQGANVFIDLEPSPQAVSGTYRVYQDSATLVDREIDSAYVYDAFREEVYMLLHTTDWQPGDSIGFKMFFPNGFNTIDASIVFEREEMIVVPAGSFQTSVVYLNTGGLLDNRIWISKGEHQRLVKFYVPNAGLNIELVSSKSS